MGIHTFNRTLIGIAFGAPLVALATSALAAADDDYDKLLQVPAWNYGPTFPAAGLYVGGGALQEDGTQYPSYDGIDVGTYSGTNTNFGGFGTSDLIYQQLTENYRGFIDGVDTGKTLSVQESGFYTIDPNTFAQAELWGTTYTQTFDGAGHLVNIEEVLDISGHDYTLFDTAL